MKVTSSDFKKMVRKFPAGSEDENELGKIRVLLTAHYKATEKIQHTER